MSRGVNHFPASAGRSRLLFKFALLTLGLAYTNQFVGARIAYFLQYQHGFALLVFLGFWITAIAALVYVALSPGRGYRIGWSIPIGLSTLAGNLFFQVMGDRMTVEALDSLWDPHMVNTATMVFYGRETLHALFGTSIVLTGLLLSPPPGLPRWRPLKALPLIPCLLSAAIILYVGGAGGNETRGLPSQFHNVGLFAVYAMSPGLDQEKADVDIPQVRPPLARHLVLIVDESVSGDFIDLNVARGTTPYLAANPEDLVNFGLALSASNCSNVSNAVLRLGAKPELLGSDGYSIFTNPSIWKYARKAGFETNYIEPHDLTGSGQNYMYTSEVALIDHLLTAPAATPTESQDVEVRRLLLEVLQRPNPQFVYVNKQGAHFPYLLAFPEDEVHFEPQMDSLGVIEDRERLVNSYKNAILYTVDRFFLGLLPRLDLADTAIIYTSDHGQNLLDDGRVATHCRRLGENLFEAVVPLLAWAGDDQLRGQFRQAAVLNQGAASHFEVFPTVLVLFGYDPAIVRERYHRSLFDRIEQPLGFVSGSITGRFGTKPVWNPREGLDHLNR